MKQRGGYFKTDAKFWNWFSSQLRKIWKDHPTKRSFVASVRYTKLTGGRKIYHVKCSMCGKEMKQIPDKGMKIQYEINHKVQCGVIREEGYANRMMDVSFDDLDVLCKPCHSVVTYSEISGMSIEDSKIEKRVIAFAKLPAKDQKKYSLGKNEKDRKDEVREKIREGLIK